MKLSLIGSQMSQMSGLRSIMEDIARSAGQPSDTEWINLSVGNPAAIPEVIEMWHTLVRGALAAGFAEGSCQYGPSRGAPALVDAIATYFNRYYGWNINATNIVVGPGSQMLAFIAAALYAGPRPGGRRRITLPLLPDYTGYQGLCMDPGGIVGLDSRVERGEDGFFRYAIDFSAVERCADIGLLLLSSPANPTGRALSTGELGNLVQIAERCGVPLLVDHAYGEPFPQVARTLTAPVCHDNVINCFSLSKAGLPGERIGFAIGPEQFITPMVSFLANSALHASRLAQSAIAAGLQSGAIDHVVSTAIRPFYETRKEMAVELLREAMPGTMDWWIHAGEGGMFCWVWVNEDWFDDLALYQLLKQDHVFVAPGRNFFAEPAGGPRPGNHATKCFRVSLTVGRDALAEGISRIGRAVRELRAARVG
jgi:valine--pyruvate aminotransferase